MPVILQNAKCKVKHEVCILRGASMLATRYHAVMDELEDLDRRLGNHLRAWREFRRMKQSELAEKIGTTGAVISLLESGDRKLSPKWLYRLAPALKTTPGHLMEHNPEDLPTDVLDVWIDVPEEDRPRVLKAIEAFKREAG
jgi:transcriptional regulator with XRE-family HTH domain